MLESLAVGEHQVVVVVDRLVVLLQRKILECHLHGEATLLSFKLEDQYYFQDGFLHVEYIYILPELAGSDLCKVEDVVH